MPLPLNGSFGRLPSRVEYLSPQGIYCSRDSSVRSPQPCGLGRGILLLGRHPPLRTVYWLTCQWLLQWSWVTFAMILDASWPGWDQQPRGIAPAAGPVNRLDRPGVSNPRGVVCCHRSTGCPGCANGCGVHGPLALVHRCTCLVWCVRGVLSVRRPWPLSTSSPVPMPCVLCVWCLWLRSANAVFSPFFLWFLFASWVVLSSFSSKK